MARALVRRYSLSLGCCMRHRVMDMWREWCQLAACGRGRVEEVQP